MVSIKQLSFLRLKLNKSKEKSFVYSVLDEKEWSYFNRNKIFCGNLLDRKSGYIHLSKYNQLKSTIEIYFPKKKIVILKIDVDNLREKLVWEKSRDGEYFPHLYDKLILENVVKVDFFNA